MEGTEKMAFLLAYQTVGAASKGGHNRPEVLPIAKVRQMPYCREAAAILASKKED